MGSRLDTTTLHTTQYTATCLASLAVASLSLIQGPTKEEVATPATLMEAMPTRTLGGLVTTALTLGPGSTRVDQVVARLLGGSPTPPATTTTRGPATPTTRSNNKIWGS